MLDGRALSEYVVERGIDVLKITPGHFAALCDGATHVPPVPRKLLIFGGEVLRRELLLQIRERCTQQGCRVINHYGPTEATIGCITCDIDFDRLPEVVPLGHPLPGVSVRLQVAERAVARGAWGELVIGGPGVGAGYVARDDLTQSVFIEVEADGGTQRRYRTGDRVRVGPDGALVFGGRVDDQVKIRGFRVELGEIDARLSALPGVTGAITLVQGESALSSIVSFVTPASVDRHSLEQQLRLTLPDYMIPSAFLALDSLPLLGNGKVDRRALARLYADRAATRSATPRTATECGLHAIVAELFTSSSVCIDRGFFEIGGNSLLATRLVNELNRRMDVQIPVKWLMENPSILQMAAMVDGLRKVTQAREPAQGQCVVEI
jgi:acyl-coenzyme A synthetase/AMP-(fatty) acid ligase